MGEEITSDEGYFSMMDCTGRKQAGVLQQSCCDDKKQEVEKLNTEHLKTVKHLEEKLEKSTKDSLEYYHEIEFLKECSETKSEEIKRLKDDHLMTVNELEKQLEDSNKTNLKYYYEIDTLKKESSTNKMVNVELQAIVQEQVKSYQMEGNEENEGYHVAEMKQSKLTDLEKYKAKLYELERKYKEMLEVKKTCELVVEQKKLKVAELREDYKRKMDELEQWKKFCVLKQHDEKKIEESNQKIMEQVVEDMTKMEQSKGLQKVVSYGYLYKEIASYKLQVS